MCRTIKATPRGGWFKTWSATVSGGTLVPNDNNVTVSSALNLADTTLDMGTGTLTAGLGHAAAVRAMPNTPVMVQSGAIGLHAGGSASAEQTNLADNFPAFVDVLDTFVNDDGSRMAKSGHLLKDFLQQAEKHGFN